MGERCVVVLGGGHTPDGLGLTVRSQERVSRAARLFHEIQADHLICSGAHAIGLDAAPPRTEAALMADLAITHGVPEATILLEERSLDTIGNIAVVGAELLPVLEPGHVWLVTSDYHLRRVRHLVRRIWTRGARVSYEAAPAQLTIPARVRTALRERVLLRNTRRVLGEIADGDLDGFLAARPLAPPADRPS